MKHVVVGLLFGLSLAQEQAQAAARPYYVCSAECLVVDLSAQAVDGKGLVIGTSRLSKYEAFADLKQKCLEEAREGAKHLPSNASVYLAKSMNVWVSNSGSGGSSWSQAPSYSVSYPIAYTVTGKSFGSSWYQYDNQMKLIIEFAKPLDPEVCEKTKTNPDAREKYIGDEKPLG